MRAAPEQKTGSKLTATAAAAAQLSTELQPNLMRDLKAALDQCTEDIFREDLAYIYDACPWITPQVPPPPYQKWRTSRNHMAPSY